MISTHWLTKRTFDDLSGAVKRTLRKLAMLVEFEIEQEDAHKAIYSLTYPPLGDVGRVVIDRISSDTTELSFKRPAKPTSDELVEEIEKRLTQPRDVRWQLGVDRLIKEFDPVITDSPAGYGKVVKAQLGTSRELLRAVKSEIKCWHEARVAYERLVVEGLFNWLAEDSINLLNKRHSVADPVVSIEAVADADADIAAPFERILGRKLTQKQRDAIGKWGSISFERRLKVLPYALAGLHPAQITEKLYEVKEEQEREHANIRKDMEILRGIGLISKL